MNIDNRSYDKCRNINENKNCKYNIEHQMTVEILGTHNEGRRLREFNIHMIHQRQDNLRRTARNLFFVCKMEERESDKS